MKKIMTLEVVINYLDIITRVQIYKELEHIKIENFGN